MPARNANVLVVEDEPQTLSLERLILESGGYTVTSAVRGEEAIEMVTDDSPDLILLDLGLPGIDGFTTCKVIRKFSQVPIIMVSGSNSGRDKVRGLDLGADDYITKPFSEAELFARSKAVLRRSNVGSQALRQSNLLWGKVLSLVSSVGYGAKARAVRVGAAQSLNNLVDKARKPQGATTCKGFLRRVRRLLLGACSVSLNELLTITRLLKQGVHSAYNSPLANRVKASRPGMKLADAASKFQRTGLAQRTKADATTLWSSGATAAAKVFNRPGQGGYPSYQPHLQAAFLIPGSEAAASPAPDTIATSPQMAFLEELLRAYLREAETRCNDPMISAPVLPLVDVYQQMLSSPKMDGKYSRQQFVRDIYLLHSSGVVRTPTGAKVQFPISRGVPNKTLTVTDRDGREVKYYGVRFTQTQDVDPCGRPPVRSFDASKAAHYRAEIKEAFCRHLEWPSEAFTQLLAAQLNFGNLSQQEIRQFAQITRDSLQGLLQERLGDSIALGPSGLT